MPLPCPHRIRNAITLTCVTLFVACSASSTTSDKTGSGGTQGGSGGATSTGTTGGTNGGSGTGGRIGSGGTLPATGGSSATSGGISGSGGSSSSGGTSGTSGSAGSAGKGAPVGSGGQTGAAGAGPSGGGGMGDGQAGADGGGGRKAGSGGQGGGTTGAGGGLVSTCSGKAWPTAAPDSMGPFAITTEKNVGPMAGGLPDAVYQDMQQRFNVYRPRTLGDGGYCHPILVWNNGHGDNPEPNPPLCNTGNGQYCGSYLVVMQQMASHGFVVISSLSTITSVADAATGKLPGIVGLEWLLQQAEDPASPYYHKLDTAHIGAFGHSQGGAATCIQAPDPRISAIATVSGTSANTGHQPTLLFCGGKEAASVCDGIKKLALSITSVPSMFVDNIAADHGGWLYQSGAKGPDIFAMTAWFRYWLMGDMAQRKYFFGADCTLCKDSRLMTAQNALLTP